MPQPACSVALAAAFGNLLQGWDNAAIAGALLYLKPEFSLDRNPGLEGVLAASSLLGAWLSTLVSGPGADWMGRRSILCVSALLYTLSSCVMFWSPNVPVLIFARVFVGGAIGISVTVVPIYIAEVAPAEIRGQLSTFPQFLGSAGMFFSYVLCFFLSLNRTPDWRLMLALLLVPSLAFLLLGVLFLPESPRWLVSKGKMLKARDVLQRLRNKVDVAAELALLVEGLRVGAESTLQEWTLEPAASRKSSLLSLEDMNFNMSMNMSWIAKESSQPQSLSRHTTSELHSMQGSFVDPVVAIFGSLQRAHDSFLESRHASERLEQDQRHDFDVEKGGHSFEQDNSSLFGIFDEDNLKSPLLSKKSMEYPTADDTGSFPNSFSRRSSLENVRSAYGSFHINAASLNDNLLLPTVGIGGGWQLGWQWEERPGKNGLGFKRVFLLQESSEQRQGDKSSASLPPAAGESIQAAALVGKPAQSSFNILRADSDVVTAIGPAILHPAETALKGPAWSHLLEGGVRRALIVGVVLQVLQQFSGINAALYYVPQILQQSGATAELIKAGLNDNSSSILGSGFACFLMLPTVAVAMPLMDHTGRRKLLLSTLPVLLLSMVMIIVSNSLLSSGTVQSAVSFVGVILYVCIFVMGFGPIPNIIASEIFPTKVRGVCIGICQLAMWSCNILLTNMFPILLVHLGLAGIFACFSVLVSVAWLFTLLKVPETKGMPLEVITEFFAMSAR